jgi:hypothetical protein
MTIKPELMDWLLASDPAIRWQVMRDLQHAPPATYEAERSRLTLGGWGARLLGEQAEDGLWNRSLYNGKWLSTTYSLYLLKLLGLPTGHSQARKGCDQLFAQGLYQGREIRFSRGQAIADLGVTALVSSIACFFNYEISEISPVMQFLVSQQAPSGNWLTNDDPSSMDYTFETTRLVLEALLQYEIRYTASEKKDFTHAVQKGREFLLNHHLGLEGGKTLKSQWAAFSFPPYWFYDILTALDYYQACGLKRDDRFQPAIDLLRAKQTGDGTWTLGSRHSGKIYYDMEAVGKPSRWNTLRALRVLTWWEGG